MNGKGSDDSGERYSYASESVETEDSQPPSPAIGYAFHPDDVGPLAPPTPLEPSETAPYLAAVENSADGPVDHPSDPYVGISPVSAPYVAGISHLTLEENPTPPPTGYTGHSGNGYDSSASSEAGYDVSASSEAGYDVSPSSEAGYDSSASSEAGYDVSTSSEAGYDLSPTSEAGYDLSAYRGGYDEAQSDAGGSSYGGNGYGAIESDADVGSPYGGSIYGGSGHAGSGYGGNGYGGNGYGRAGDDGAESDANGGSTHSGSTYGGSEFDGNGSSTYTGRVYGGSGSATVGYGDDEVPVAPVYRGRARVEAKSQPRASGLDLAAYLGSGQTYDPPPAFEAGDLYGSVAVVDPPASVRSTRPGFTLTEDLAEQRRQDARRIEKEDAEEQRAQMPLWQELPLLLVVAFCVAVLIRSFLLQAFYIPSSSMEQTLLVGDRVLVNKILYDLRSPERGEVVVFRGTDRWAPENFGEEPGGMLDRIGDTLGDLVGVSSPGEKDFIKRVIGLPGDRVACCDDQGRVTVNGVGIDEPYINANSSLDIPPTLHVCGSRRFAEVVVPEDHLFVMGDNRAVSQDSRCQGTVPIENVIGRAFLIVWPGSRWDTLSVPDTFGAVPEPVAVGRLDPEPADPVAAVLVLPVLASLVASSRPRLVGLSRARRLRR